MANPNKRALSEYQKPLPRGIVICGTLTLVGIISFLDAITDPYFSFSLLYLIPIYLAIWYGNKTIGIIVLAISIGSMLLHDGILARPIGHPLVPYWTVGLNLILFIAFLFIVEASKKAIALEKTYSRIDYLTGAANSRYLFDIGVVEISRARRYRRPLSLAFMDVDNFKAINDSFGHKDGDKLLVSLVKSIKQSVRSGDIVARIGGDEFVILLPETTYEASDLVIRRVRVSLLEIMKQKGWPATFSIGLVTCANSDYDLEKILTTADNLMYDVKNNGKNMIKHQMVGELVPPS